MQQSKLSLIGRMLSLDTLPFIGNHGWHDDVAVLQDPLAATLAPITPACPMAPPLLY